VTHVDSSFLIDLLREHARQRPGPATGFLESHAGESLGASVFVACELEAGGGRAAHPDRERSRVRGLLQSLAIAYPDERFAATYGELFARIMARGHTVSQMDLLIATAAIVDGVPLLTANEKHFAVVPDLRVVSYRKSG
jgi:tRNA(fMet)-specific endonuclease VapC